MTASILANRALRLAALMVFACLGASAQSNQFPSTNGVDAEGRGMAEALRVERIRSNCIENRRRVCGKILQVLPDGLVVDSGYTELAQTQFKQSWLAPGTIVAQKATNVIEEKWPGCFCYGLVFLSDLPKSRGAKPKPYDYVNLEAFPDGEYTYVSVGDLHRTVRRFSAKLPVSLQWALDEADKKGAPPK